MFKKRNKELTEEEKEVIRTKSFFDMILPSTIKFSTDHYVCGDSYRCVWAIKEYPPTTEELALFSTLADRNNLTIHLYSRMVDAIEQRKIIQNATRKNKLSTGSNDVQENITAEGNLEDVVNLIAELRKNKEPLLHCAVFLELKADSMQKLRELQSEIQMELTRSKMSVDRLTLRQKEGFLTVLPVGYNIFREQFERVLPASSVANLYPFNYSGKGYQHNQKNIYREETLQELCLGLHSMCVGTESKYFNGHTNIIDDTFLCFGVKGLMDTNRRLKDAMLFNVLSYMTNELLGKGNTIAAMGIIGNMDSIEIDTNQVQQSIVQNMSAEEKAKLQHIEDVMTGISKECSKRKLKSIVGKKAQAVYACAFYDIEKTDSDFISKLVDCFEQAKDDNELLNMLNSVFDTNISAEDFSHLMSVISNTVIDIDLSNTDKNNLDLVKWAQMAYDNKWGYVWGSHGNVLTANELKRLEKTFGSHVTDKEEYINNLNPV